MACRDTKFALAGLGNDAGMYGCVEMLLDQKICYHCHNGYGWIVMNNEKLSFLEL